MNLTQLWLFLHLSLIFTGITISYGITTMLRVAYATGQVTPLRGVGITAGKLGRYIAPIFGIGGLFGLVTGLSQGLNLLAPWLVIAYVLFAMALAIGALENAPFGMKLGKLLMNTPDGPITPEIRELFDDRRTVYLTVIDYVLPFLLVFDMVVKPFGT